MITLSLPVRILLSITIMNHSGQLITFYYNTLSLTIAYKLYLRISLSKCWAKYELLQITKLHSTVEYYTLYTQILYEVHSRHNVTQMLYWNVIRY